MLLAKKSGFVKEKTYDSTIDSVMNSISIRCNLDAIETQLHLAKLLSEKCELAAAHQAYERVWKLAQTCNKPELVLEALLGLLRMAAEALDASAVQHWSSELDHWSQDHKLVNDPCLWYGRGAALRASGVLLAAQNAFFRSYRCSSGVHSEIGSKAWVMLSVLHFQR